MNDIYVYKRKRKIYNNFLWIKGEKIFYLNFKKKGKDKTYTQLKKIKEI